MRISVGRVSKDKPQHENVKVDRSSLLGNPFFMRDESMRDDVCDSYYEYFMGQIKDRDSVVSYAVNELLKIARSGKALNLQCHCAPKRCHADTIKQYLLENA